MSENLGQRRWPINPFTAIVPIIFRRSISLLFLSILYLPFINSSSHAADPRFVDLQNGTVYDTVSNLMWLKDADCFGLVSWGNAKILANNLASGQCFLNDGSAAGTWHLPTINELRIFVDDGYRADVLKALGFNNVQTIYWTETAGASNLAWVVDMVGGYAYLNGNTGSTHMWPVRSGPFGFMKLSPATTAFATTVIGTPSATSEFTIRNSGSGAVAISEISITGANSNQFLVAPGGSSPCFSLAPTLPAGGSCTVNVTFRPTSTGVKSANLHVASNALITTRDAPLSGTGSGRFVDLQNGTLYDPVSKLIWVKYAECAPPPDWAGAIALTNSLATGQRGLTDGSVAGDWRLPTIDELRLFVDGGFRQDTLMAAGFSSVQNKFYWSSSTDVGDSGYAWGVFFDNGYVGVANKTYTGCWLPVRNGQAGTSGTLSISPAAATYPDTIIDTQSAPIFFTLKNGAANDVSISSILLTGTDASQFTMAPGGAYPCPSLTPTLAPGGSCTVSITFSPTSGGAKSANLHVVNNSLIPTVDASLGGNSIRFADLKNGAMYDIVSKLIWLKNANCNISPVNWFSAIWFGDTLANGYCGLTDGSAAGDWHLPTLDELKTLVDAGYRTDSLKAAGFSNVFDGQNAGYWSSTDDSTNSSAALVVNMSGGFLYGWPKGNGGNLGQYFWAVRSGSSGFIKISPAATNFAGIVAGTQSTPTTFTISNSGSGAVSVSVISINGINADEFSVAPGGPNPCSSSTPTLAAGGSCTVNVTFKPTSTGEKTASLHVVSNALMPTLDASLSGTGAVRFVDLQNGTMYDTVSKLIWLKNADCYGTKDWYSAIASTNSLASGQCGLTDASSTGDWHLPSIEELRIFIDSGFRANTLNLGGFSNVTNTYWSSSAYNQSLAWLINMTPQPAVVINHYKSSGIDVHVWPVHSGQAGSSGALFISPATTTFMATIESTQSAPTNFTIRNKSAATVTVSSISITGTNPSEFSVAPGGSSPCSSLTPSLAAGAGCTVSVTFAPTSPGPKSASLHVISNSLITTVDAALNGNGTARFVNLKNGTVLDIISKLVWLENANCFGAQPWGSTKGEAMFSSNYLSSGQCGLKDGSVAGDWHLPTIDELRIFVDAGYQTDTLNNHRFLNVQSGIYWSDSTNQRTPSEAFAVNMAKGSVVSADKGIKYYLWPVRSGVHHTLTTTKSGSGDGSVTPDSGSISWIGNTGTANYSIGTTVTLMATPDSTSIFGGWSGDCTTEPCSVTMYAAQGVTANFNLAPVAMNTTTNKPYTNLLTAISDALPGDEIRTLDTQLDGAVSIDKSIHLKGGWNTTYTNKTGLPTTLKGILTILNGSSTAEIVVVKGKIFVQRGSLRVKAVKVLP